MVNWLGKFVKWMLFGCLVGGALTAWIAPNAIIWYFTPPVPTGLDCRAPIEWSLHRFVLTEALGTFIGGTLGAAIAIAFGRRRKKLATGSHVPPGTPTGPMR